MGIDNTVFEYALLSILTIIKDAVETIKRAPQAMDRRNKNSTPRMLLEEIRRILTD